jgi:hypothetical protein
VEVRPLAVPDRPEELLERVAGAEGLYRWGPVRAEEVLT